MLDWVGCILCLGFSTCIVLGLTWGGAVKPWKSVSVLFPLCLAGVLLVLFVFWEAKMGRRALVPLHLFKRQTHAGACLEGLWLLTALIVATYYLPFWYQINGRSSIQSGVDILPLMLSFVIAAGISSGVTTFTGHYFLLLLVPPALSIVGTALLFTVSASTSSARLLGYQILVGAGVGGSFQTTYVALQAEWADDPEKTTQASAILTFMSNFGGLIGLSIAGTLFNNCLGSHLASVPGITPELLKALSESITVITTLPEPLQSNVREASVKSLSPVFLIIVVTSALGIVSAIPIKSYNLKERSTMVEGRRIEDK